MRTKAILAISALAVILLSSCINIYQHISSGGNGRVDIYTQLTVSKLILEMANGMSGEGEAIDYDDWLSENANGDFGKLSEKIKVDSGKINNDLDIGMFYRASVNYEDKNVTDLKSDEGIVFFPIIENGRMTIRTSFSSGKEAVDESSNMANAFLGSAKYILTIDKHVISNIESAKIMMNDEEVRLCAIDSNDEFLIDIPMVLLMSGNSTIVIE